MARITKSPDERKKEIIEVASKLFNEKGYENTAVSDIVKTINIAQGTFYYYFKSKDEIIEPIVEYIMNKSLAEVEEIIKGEGTATEKISAIVTNRIRFVINSGRVVRFVWNKNNNFMFEKFKKYAIPKAAPLFKRLVEQGEKEGIMSVEYPDETIRLIIITALDIVEQFLAEKEIETLTDSEIYLKMKAYENIIKRLLGVVKEIDVSLVDMIAGEFIKKK